jgi:signal recognition particle subunit SRP54
MFGNLSDKLGGIFDRLTRRGTLSEKNIDEAMREIRIALLEADVALPVVKDFVKTVKKEALGAKVIKSVTPGQMVVKIVNDALVEMLGGESEGINLKAAPPVPVLFVGLQGSGKTTSCGKLGKMLKDKHGKKVLMASLDVYRPAAQEQLAQLGLQSNVDTLEIIKEQKPVAIAERAMKEARIGGYDVVLLDTAGRLHIDEKLMEEVAQVRDVVKPTETLLVADAMTGQDAVNVSKEFNEKIGVTGIVLTRIDGDARGGAALSMKAVTGCPIKFLGVSEKLDGWEKFHPDRLASRILGMGDIVSLVENAAEKLDKEEAEKVAKNMLSGKFTLDDMLSQLQQVKKLGNLQGILAMMPGINKMQKQIANAGIDDSLFKKQEAMILSMTKKERQNPEIIKASRKVRISKGSGTSVQDINKLLKQHKQMSSMMKKMKKTGLLGKMLGGGMGGFAPPADMDLPVDLSDRGPMGGTFAPFEGGSMPNFGGSNPFAGGFPFGKK